MGAYYLAIDIGASSGRHILGSVEKGRLRIEEIYRFENGMKRVEDTLCWDLDYLFHEIKQGLKKCKENGKTPEYIGIDTWAVDFVLLDLQGDRIGKSIAYRDKRTSGMDDKVYSILTEKELYGRNGIQKQIFNTIYQLMAISTNEPEDLKAADCFLMIPDYFNYLLTGVKRCEYTNATTTQMVSPATKDWDKELMKLLGYPEHIFPELSLPGTVLGRLKADICDEIGFDCQVMLPATHDTGSAVIAVPARETHPLYISSGTWSLMGTELTQAGCSSASREKNFTNEGGYDYRFRYLKNIMGLWMIQSVKKEIAAELSYGEICEMASKIQSPSIIDCNDGRFLSPKNMTLEIQEACRETGQQVPQGIAELAAVIYKSLAKCYGDTVLEMEELLDMHFDQIYVVGGGSSADYLNRLTAEISGKNVYAGPTEATAIGNLLAQMMGTGEIENLAAARECVRQSFQIAEYKSK